MIRDYYELVKPGIVYGNMMTTLSAFIFAAHHQVNFPLLIATLSGVSLSIAGGCVINNILDRDIDLHMERTKGRAIPNGRISSAHAAAYGALLGISGLATLFFFTTYPAFFVTLIGVIVYLALYTPAKRMTQHSTIIGSVAGAVPPVAGYAAAANTLDTTAALLFLILVCWQMTHFFAIAIFRKEEYKHAKLPIMSVKAGVTRTKVLMLLYAILFAYAAILLGFRSQLGLFYLLPMTAACAGWILYGIYGLTAFRSLPEYRWARSMFFYSLATLMIFSVTLAFG